jgi:DNA mismatch repair protein MutS2
MSGPKSKGRPAAVGVAPSPAARFSATGLDLELVRAQFVALAYTSLGARALRELRPLDDAEAAKAVARADDVALLSRAGDALGFAGVVDLQPAREGVERFHRPLERDELASLAGFLAACTRLVEWLEERRIDTPALFELTSGFPPLSKLRKAVEAAVDERGELRDDASPRLARLRADSRSLEAKISEVVARILADPTLRPHVADFKVHRRGGRRVIAFKARSSTRIHGVVHERSQSGETVFVEPREAVEHSNRLVELEQAIRAEEARILVELTRLFLEHGEMLDEAGERLAKLEIAAVSVRYAKDFGARMAAIGEFHADKAHERGLVLRGARHPLLVEQLRAGGLSEVVPIDVRLGGEFDLLVVTGPNTGGKTLALKTVGVAAWCMRLGLPVCCDEGSRVPLYDGVIADIGDEQEIRQSLSTFASHLARIKAGLEGATDRTLCLLDELGGGTDPDEGGALGAALLEHLLERRIPTIATTHIGKLKEFCFAHGRAENASVEFDAASLKPRYRLLVGTPGESNALSIAERRGLPAPIVARAREMLVRRDRDAADLMRKLRGASEHTEQLRRDAEARIEDLRRSGQALEQRQSELAKKGELLEAEAQRALEERIRDARKGLENAQALLSQLPAERAAAMRAALDEIERALSRASLTDRRKGFLDGLDKGQLVFIPRYRQRCAIKKVDYERRVVTVRLGSMNLAVPFDEITWCETS